MNLTEAFDSGIVTRTLMKLWLEKNMRDFNRPPSSADATRERSEKYALRYLLTSIIFLLLFIVVILDGIYGSLGSQAGHAVVAVILLIVHISTAIFFLIWFITHKNVTGSDTAFINDCVKLNRALETYLPKINEGMLHELTTAFLISSAKKILALEAADELWAHKEHLRRTHENFRKEFLVHSNLFRKFIEPRYDSAEHYFAQAKKELEVTGD